MVQKHKTFIVGCAVTLGIAFAQRAWSDLYGYVDENGRAHVSTRPLDARYLLFKRDRAKDHPVNSANSKAGTSSAPTVVVVPKVAPIPKSKVKLYRKQIDKAAQQYRVDAALLHAVIAAESQYEPRAVSPRGAQGLMQLMPETAERYKVNNVFDPTQNIQAGAKFLRDLLRRFDNNLSLALAAYNAGEGAVIKAGWRVPPYPETEAYVPKVLAYYKQYLQKI
jgi:soluble lytic murein transglycosylase-like protein